MARRHAEKREPGRQRAAQPRVLPHARTERRRTPISDTPLRRGREVLRLLAATILLPLVLVALGLWEVRRGASDLATAEIHHARTAKAVAALEARAGTRPGSDPGTSFTRNGQNYAGPLALTEARKELDDAANNVTLARVRRTVPPFVVFPAAAVAVLSLLVLVTGAVLARRGRRSRDALVRGFSLVRRALPPVLGAQVVLAATAAVAATGFEASAILFGQLQSGGEIKLLFLALVIMGVSVFVAGSAVLGLRRALAAFEPDPLPIEGRVLSREDAPGLWARLDRIAERLGALRPDNVVAGLTGGFFVASGPKVLEPGGGAIAGRTLYVPLPMLALLREDEAEAVLAHELAHFSGEDTEYSLRFLPIYAGVGRSLDALAEAGGGDGSGSILLRPALQLGTYVLDGFHRAVRHWSREREFAADRAGAEVASPDAAARALLRTPAAAPVVGATLRRAAEAPDAAPANLVAATLEAARAGLDDPSRHLEETQPHPTDTHPPTRTRLAALGRDADAALLAAASAPAEPGLRAFLADPDAAGRAATEDFLTLVRRHEAEMRGELEAAVAAVEGGERSLQEHTRPGAILLGVMGVFFGAMGVGLGFVAGVDAEPEVAWGLAAFGIVGGLLLLWLAFVVWQRGDAPYAVLRADSIAIAGLSAPITWDSVMDVELAAMGQRVTTTLHLLPGATLPERTGGPRRAKVDRKRRTVILSAGLPKGMKVPEYAELIGSYRRAVMARRVLQQGADRGASVWVEGG
ncbi:M48 family metalloprotease [Roseomonas sp. CCTCC AB2023176]|uniref:M48 family metalloprotease n=1 Tax=Roseomonas sp. CCTCC AB2023176 TaxID=3342640 RepID=UPI0035DDA616